MSNLPTVNVTARVYDQNGRPVQRAVVGMRLTTVERYGGYVVPREARAETDASGLAVLRVWPNELGSEKSEYRVHVRYPHNGCEQSCHSGGGGAVSGYAVVPNHDCDLQDIMELAPYDYRGAGQVIASEVALYAGQASAARDAAQSCAASVQGTVRMCDDAAGKAEAARDAAQIAARLADGKAGEAAALVERADDRIVYFEKDVVGRVETETNRLTTAATTTIRAERDAALTNVETRAAAVIMEVTATAAGLKADAVHAVERVRDQTLDAVDKAKEDGVAAFHEEGELFREDFEQLVERAESGAKKAGCASIAAQSHADRACSCADSARTAAENVETSLAGVLEAARAAETAKTCAESAATEARIKAAETSAARDGALVAARESRDNATAARRDAVIAEQARDTAVTWKDAAAGFAGQAQASAAEAGTHADRAGACADDVEGAIRNAALGMLAPQVVNEAVARATTEATAAAEAAEADALTATQQANLAKKRADRAEAARDIAEDLAGKLLRDYHFEQHALAMSAQLIRLADRVTRVELDQAHGTTGTGGGSLTPGGMSPAPGVTVSPLTIVEEGAEAPVGAAVVAHVAGYVRPDIA